MELLVSGIGGHNKHGEITIKNNEYLDYIVEHVENVKIAYNNLFGKLSSYDKISVEGFTDKQIEEAIEELSECIIHHDESKYTDVEFYAYGKKYHKTEYEELLYKINEDYKNKVDDEAEAAWKHHYTNNSHHPRFWKWVDKLPQMKSGVYVDYNILSEPRDVALDMPLVDILHMICDWEAMGIKFKSKTIDWYLSDKATNERNDMSPLTRKRLESILEQLYNVNIPEKIEV